MARAKGGGPRRPGGLYEQLLLFPERAEYLEQKQYGAYRIRLDHWRELSTEFRSAFERVYERKSAAVLLVYGAQGTGKTLFTRKLEEDFGKKTEHLDPENLWHVLAGGDPPDVGTVQKATDTTTLRRVDPEDTWLNSERSFAAKDDHPMRVFVVDDFQKDAYVRELAGLSQIDYLRLKADGKEAVVLQSVAQRVVEDCRGAFARSLFVLLSNDQKLLDALHREIERSHAGLSRPLSLPLPDSELKEEIVRTNTNRLNKRSYWYCLDQGGPKEKRQAYDILVGTGGFIDAFQAIDRALGAGAGRRAGRPANKNLLTLVTLGAEPIAVKSFVEELDLHPAERFDGDHLGAWLFRETWATAFGTDAGEEYSRKASLVESEFALRWVALSSAATWQLCEAPARDPLALAITDCIRYAPRIGASKLGPTETLSDVDAKLAPVVDAATVARFAEDFRAAGQNRFRAYEPALAGRFEVSFSRGIRVHGALRPDVILEDHEPCALTRSTSDDPKAIEAAIRRGCHVIEFTAYLRADLRGLSAYVRGKVESYAALLEEV
jgi:hypothetical protein